ncbi:hypothetical protein D1BOALGB6SA_5853, partial [Olavius sp. associated proteobacterium Delta 1]
PSLLTLKIITVKIAVNPLIHLTSLRYAGDQLVSEDEISMYTHMK